MSRQSRTTEQIIEAIPFASERAKKSLDALEASLRGGASLTSRDVTACMEAVSELHATLYSFRQIVRDADDRRRRAAY